LTLNANRGITLQGGGGTFTQSGITTLSYGGTIAGSGALTEAGTGHLALLSANSYTGLTTISSGFIDVFVNDALGATSAGTVVTSSGELILRNNVLYNSAEPLQINGGFNANNNGAIFASTDAKFAGNITVDAAATDATIRVRATNVLLLTGTLSLNNHTLKFGSSLGLLTNGTVVVTTGTITSGGVLGTLQVAAGTLQMDGAASLPVTVDSGAILSGKGTGGTNLVVIGTATPGDYVTNALLGLASSQGDLTVISATFNAGSRLQVRITGTSPAAPVSDRLVTSTLTLNGAPTLAVDLAGLTGTYTSSTVVTVATFAVNGLNGTFAAAVTVVNPNGHATPTWSSTTTTIDVTFHDVPPPVPGLFLRSGGGDQSSSPTDSSNNSNKGLDSSFDSYASAVNSLAETGDLGGLTTGESDSASGWLFDTSADDLAEALGVL